MWIGKIIMKDYYNILGVDKKASRDEIKKKFKTLAFEFHPDRAPEEKRKEFEDKFKEISEAYDILSDDNKRAQYDNPVSSFNPFDSNINNDFFRRMRMNIGLDDLFNNMHRNHYKQPEESGDENIALNITFEEMVKGVNKEVKYTKNIPCNHCNGSGGKLRTCNVCNGTGYITKNINKGRIIFNSSYPCTSCRNGKIIEEKCKHCDNGYVSSDATINITINPGIHHGSILRCVGAGNVTRNKQRGNLFIHINIEEHDVFERVSDCDIGNTIKIDMIDLALGCEILIDTVYKKNLKVKIPPGTQHGAIIKIESNGIGEVGDHLLGIEVEIPKNLTSNQRSVLRNYKEL